jgi:hypothetical protein
MNCMSLQFVVTTLGGLIHRGQQQEEEYLIEENRVLREQLGKKRLRLTNDQRRRLTVRAKALGRAGLNGIACIVTPDTLLRWYRNLVDRDPLFTRRFVDILATCGVKSVKLPARSPNLNAYCEISEAQVLQRATVSELDKRVLPPDQDEHLF